MFELAHLLDTMLPLIKRSKSKSLLLLAALIFYSAIPLLQVPFIEYGSFRISALMEQRAIENSLIFYPKRTYAEFEDINPLLFRCILSIEDNRFFTHRGIDWEQLFESLDANKRKGKIKRGGSTVSMQLVKNLYFRTTKSYLRKAKELLVTIRMEKEVPKQDILRVYANVIEWGEGIFGIGAAASIFFKNTPEKLSLDQTARLTAVIPSPLRHNPSKNSSYVLRRSSIIKERYPNIVLPDEITQK